MEKLKIINFRTLLSLALIAVLGACVVACKSSPATGEDGATVSEETAAKEPSAKTDKASAGENAAAKHQVDHEPLPVDSEEPGLKIATFAAGCFWCIEPPFDKTAGVKKTIVGYTGGSEKMPTYEDVSYGRTGHAESIRVYFNPDEVSYEELLTVFWHNINPTQKNGQFVDHGKQYRSAIFYHNAEQKRLAQASKNKLGESGRFDKPIVTQIVSAQSFWKAEEYHQNFYKKSPERYHSYHDNSGRAEYIEKTWGE